MDKSKRKQANRRKFNKICRSVEKAAVSREACQGKLDYVEFFVGAMSAMTAMGFEPPASWVFGIMGNRRSMLGLPEKGKQK